MIDPTQSINANEQSTRRQSARIASLARRAREVARIRDLERQMSELEERLRKLNNENELNFFREALTQEQNRFNTADERRRSLNLRIAQESTRLRQEQMDSNAGLEYTSALNDYEDYRNNVNPSDHEGIIRRYNIYNRILEDINAIVLAGIRPLFVERERARHQADKAQRNYDNLLKRQQNRLQEIRDLQQEIGDLQQNIDALRRQLTQAQGKRRHRTTYKKNKRFINSKNRKKLHTLRKKRRRTN